MAFSNNYKLNVDLKRRLTSIVPTFKQGDSGRIEFTIYDDGNLYDLSTYTYSELTFRLPDGEVLVGNPILENGKIVYNFTGTEMSQIGKVTTVLTIMSGQTSVSIQPFSVFIFDSMKNEDLSYIGILQELIAEVQNLQLSTVELTARLTEQLALSQDKIEEMQALIDSTTSAEETRVSNESQRITNESERVSEESTRINNEIQRVNNETERIENELIRQQTLQQMTTLVDGFETFVYSSTQTYDFPNLVTYNGSTYFALKSVVGINPSNDGINWRIAAQRGVDGNGSVSSVNGVLPDENGNVEIQAGGGDGSVIISSTQPSEQQTGGLWLRTY